MSSSPRMSRNAFNRCPEDQFYDAVVEQCGACADICKGSAATMTSCQSNCPGYLSKTYRTSPEVPSSARTSHGAVAVMHVTHRLIDKPLFWTSVISMGVALLATIGIIILCVLRLRASSRRSAYSRRRLGVRNVHTCDMNPPADPHDRRFSRSETCSFSNSGSIAKNKYKADGSDDMLVSLHSTFSPESIGHSTANRLEYFAMMAPLISEEQGSITCHLGTDVHVSARAPYLSIESCPNKSLQLPLYVRSINRQSINTSVDGSHGTLRIGPGVICYGRLYVSVTVQYLNSQMCWTLSSTAVPQLFETSVKHLSVEDVSSDNALLSVTSQCDRDMVLPLAQVPGSKLRPSVLHQNDDNIVVSMRSETGYRSEHITLVDCR